MVRSHKKDSIRGSDIVPVVGDAAIAGPIVDGRMVPLLIVDTSDRPDIDELIRVHAHLTHGDVIVNWGTREGSPDSVVLVLDFLRPIELRAVIVFSVERQAILVDSALAAGAVYLQSGRPGDRLISDPDRQKILVEIPDTEFASRWEPIFLNVMTAYISKKSKIPKKKAYPKARLMLEELRKITLFRMRQ